MERKPGTREREKSRWLVVREVTQERMGAFYEELDFQK